MTLTIQTLPRCRFCETVLVGAETLPGHLPSTCDLCADELCAACGENQVEFHVSDLPAQLCNECHDDWMAWHDPVLAVIAVPLESDLQEGRERFVQWRQAGNRAEAAHDLASLQIKNRLSPGAGGVRRV